MKNTIFAIITFLIIILLLSPSIYSQKETSVRGLVIFTSKDYIEVKRGWHEYKLTLSEGVPVYYKNEKAAVTDIAICQRVRAFYVEEKGVKRLTKVEINSSSYCYK